jgi:hypothetical protein
MLPLILSMISNYYRFYPVEGTTSYDEKSYNVKPGTVVDRGVTMERGYDFFMVAHTGLQGTCRPAHYAVLYDEIGLGPDNLQNLVCSSSQLYTFPPPFFCYSAFYSVSILTDLLVKTNRPISFAIFSAGQQELSLSSRQLTTLTSSANVDVATSMTNSIGPYPAKLLTRTRRGGFREFMLICRRRCSISKEDKYVV